MKTLDDALKVPGVIPEGRYRMEEGFDICSQIGGDKNEVRLKGRFVPEELRRIADHLDPSATEEPRGCPLPGVCACAVATLHIDRIKAEARREALEEAAKACALLAESFTGHAAAGAFLCSDAVHDLIEQEPTA